MGPVSEPKEPPHHPQRLSGSLAGLGGLFAGNRICIRLVAPRHGINAHIDPAIDDQAQHHAHKTVHPARLFEQLILIRVIVDHLVTQIVILVVHDPRHQARRRAVIQQTGGPQFLHARQVARGF